VGRGENNLLDLNDDIVDISSQVVPDGFGIAYVTGYDGKPRMSFLSCTICSHRLILDRLQYTITSRTEMPNAQFNGEIAKAAVDLYELHSSVRKSKL